MRQNTKGFSLVELMIVVAIIGILAAIAIPNFVAMQLKSKRAELPSNVSGIKTAELAYDASFDGFESAAEQPRAFTATDKELVSWDNTQAGWQDIGWEPDGKVRGAYAVTLGGSTNDFNVKAECNVDAEGDFATYTASKTVGTTLETGDEDVY